MLFCVLQDFILKWTQWLNAIIKIIVTSVNWLVVFQIIAPDFGRWGSDRGGAVVCVPTNHLLLRQFGMHPIGSAKSY